MFTFLGCGNSVSDRKRLAYNPSFFKFHSRVIRNRQSLCCELVSPLDLRSALRFHVDVRFTLLVHTMRCEGYRDRSTEYGSCAEKSCVCDTTQNTECYSVRAPSDLWEARAPPLGRKGWGGHSDGELGRRQSWRRCAHDNATYRVGGYVHAEQQAVEGATCRTLVRCVIGGIAIATRP